MTSSGLSVNIKRLAVNIIRLEHGRDLDLPAYQSPGASGIDLVAAISAANDEILPPGARMLVPTGISMAIPKGYEAQVRPRSGLAAKHGVTVLNTPGTIDSDYRGEIKVILINLGNDNFRIIRGERIAQLVFQRVEQADLTEVVELSETGRGEGGFGSTGRA